MSHRASHRFTAWVLPIASSVGLVSGSLGLADYLIVMIHQSALSRRDRAPIAPPSGAAQLVQQRSTRSDPDARSSGAIVLPQRFSSARPVPVGARQVADEPIYLTRIDLTDPEVFLGLGLAHNAKQANNHQNSHGDERFTHMVRRHRAAVTVSGTFFSMDQQKRVMGNMVSGGRFLKFSPWENYGTTLGLRVGNQPEMLTARTDGQPQWQQHWFSITAGPRLLRQGQVQINPQAEGFTDRTMFKGKSRRVVIGYPKHGHQLMLVTFRRPVTLQKAAAVMRYLGNDEAMNLDGGTSVGLAKGNEILQSAGRKLTNVITIYDIQHPAPQPLRDAWRAFQQGPNVITQAHSVPQSD